MTLVTFLREVFSWVAVKWSGCFGMGNGAYKIS